MAQLLTLISCVTFLFSNYAVAFFILPGQNLLSARIDPIVDPGRVASHVHNVVGGNNFANTFNYDNLVQSACTSVGVTIDRSNYWAPAMFYLDYSGGPVPVFQRLDSNWNIYYLLRKGSGETVKAWPVGLRMLAGDPKRSTYDPTKLDHQAISFHCLNYQGPDGGEYPEFPPKNCPNGIRAQVFFPSCWDGQNLDSADHKSHMSYPVGHYDSGPCPTTHPVRLISLFYEQVFYATGQFPFRTDKPMFALSTGDTTGYSYHGDFTMGWQGDILQKAVDTCDDTFGVLDNCAVLKPYIDNDAARACRPSNPVPLEEVGLNGPLRSLPGDNALWSKNTPKVSVGPLPVPLFGSPKSVIPPNWSSLGCIAEPTNLRALTGASFSDNTLTLATCITFCESKGFSIAGAEWNRECYCDDTLRNGASATALLDSKSCWRPCSGNAFENCGGDRTLTVYSRSSTNSASMTPSSTSSSTVPPTTTSAIPTSGLPTSWTYKGCIAEPIDNYQRALVGAFMADDQMTLAKCINFCQSKNFSLAGAEWSRECFCDNALRNGARNTILDPKECWRPCSGNATETCGGDRRLSIFAKTGAKFRRNPHHLVSRRKTGHSF